MDELNFLLIKQAWGRFTYLKMKMYKISSWGFEIKEVEITRKSDSSIWYMYGRNDGKVEIRRESNTYYFETWEAAKQKLIDRNKRDLEDAKRAVERAEQQLFASVLASQ